MATPHTDHPGPADRRASQAPSRLEQPVPGRPPDLTPLVNIVLARPGTRPGNWWATVTGHHTLAPLISVPINAVTD